MLVRMPNRKGPDLHFGPQVFDLKLHIKYISSEPIGFHRVASTPELATNFIGRHDDGKKKLLLDCFITALCVKMDTILSEHMYL